jgi:hypothetical protein
MEICNVFQLNRRSSDDGMQRTGFPEFGKEPDELWPVVDGTLEGKCKGRAAKVSKAIAQIEHAMRLQLQALE